MREAGLEDLHRVQLGILECVARFCEEHKINYWLDYGTLLGAVRHKGFIPWDDDIDIGMMRKDYEKFKALFKSGQNDRYQFHCMENNSDYLLLYGKIFDNDEVFVTDERETRIEDIDLFIYDNVPDDDDEAEKMFRKRKHIRRLFVMSRKRSKPEGNIFRRACAYAVRYVMRTFLKGYILKRTVNFIRRYEDVPTKRVGGLTCWESLMCRREVFEELTELEFEGKKYKAPANYDEWLTTVYGDYMKLPPVEERVPKHTNTIKLYLPVN